MHRLQNKVALVTGGSRGIGAAIVQRLAAEGAAVAFTFVQNHTRAAEVVAAVTGAGGKALAIKASNSEAAELVAAVKQTVDTFGRLDILVNNAGMFIAKPLVDFSLAEFDEIMSVNTRAVFVAIREAIQYLPAGGRIISIGSNISVQVPRPNVTVYAMGKAALVGLTKGLARELGPREITVNLVEPGPVDTEMNPADSERANGVRAQMAIQRYGKAADIASMVALLAAGEANFVTGSVIRVDGGITA